MPPNKHKTPPNLTLYSAQTLSPLNCLAFVLPLLVFFHIGAAVYGSTLLAPRYVYGVLKFFGATSWYLPGLLIVTVLLIQHAAGGWPWKVHGLALAGMAGESVLWTLPLVALSYLTGHFTLNAAAGGNGLVPVLDAVGAGVYEEFTFRLVLLSLAMLIFVDVAGLKKDVVVIFFIFAGAIAFSLCHFTFLELSGHAHFNWSKFAFLAAAGVLWGIIYVYRGFAIAVGSHIAWDLFVVFIHTRTAV